MAPDILAEVDAPTAVLHCLHSYYSTLPAKNLSEYNEGRNGLLALSQGRVGGAPGDWEL